MVEGAAAVEGIKPTGNDRLLTPNGGKNGYGCVGRVVGRERGGGVFSRDEEFDPSDDMVVERVGNGEVG
jgi:hypothetical protein